MGGYDAGRYGTPLIARTNTIGETITGSLRLGGDLFLMFEQGLGGQMGRPPIALQPAGWNDFANSNVGATFVNHAHVGLAYAQLLRLGFHYLTAWTQDDLADGGVGSVPDGRITVLGADINLTAGRAGHLYFGVARTWATNAETVSGAIEILNARGGPDLQANYLGINLTAGRAGHLYFGVARTWATNAETVSGAIEILNARGGPDLQANYLGIDPTTHHVNGHLTIFGGQYDLSLARLVFGKWYSGFSPDVMISLFGVGAAVSSADPTRNGILKLKGGVEATYLFLSWMGVSERFDHVREDNSDSKQAFTSLSSRLLFHTGWRSRNEIALQYAYFVYGSSVQALTGYPPVIEVNPDRQVFSLTGTIWW